MPEPQQTEALAEEAVAACKQQLPYTYKLVCVYIYIYIYIRVYIHM